jgi:hypothetical protein
LNEIKHFSKVSFFGRSLPNRLSRLRDRPGSRFVLVQFQSNSFTLLIYPKSARNFTPVRLFEPDGPSLTPARVGVASFSAASFEKTAWP